MNWSENLKPFVRRVRLARAWKGAAVGLTAGGIAALIWAVLDYTVRWYAEWPQLLSLAGAGTVIGSVVGFFWKLEAAQVAASIDRRANLKDRLATALEDKLQASTFAEAQEDDARESLYDVRPREIYPLKVSRWHWSGVGMTAVSIGLFVLLSSNVLLNPDQKKAKEEAEKVAAAIERIAKPLEEKKPADSAAAKAQERLAKEMRKLAKDIKKTRLTKEEALQKANELSKEAQKLAEDRIAKAEQDMMTARDQLTQMELEKSGIDPETLEKLSLSAEQKKMLSQAMQKQGMETGKKGKFDQKTLDAMGLNQLSAEMMNMDSKELEGLKEALSKEMSDLENKAKSGNLSEADKKRLEQLKKIMESLKLSEEATKGLEELMNSDVAKELQELMSKMQQAQEKAEKGEPMTDEEMEAMKKAMEELAKKLEDPKFREEMKKQMEEMLQALKDGKLTLGQCKKCMGLLGMAGMPNMPGASGPGSQYDFPDTGKINKSDGLKTSGDGLPMAVRGERDDKRGTETYIEIKAPTAPGARSSVPYSKVLPKYTDRAEQSLGKQKVPKKHEERVKNYFDSLNGGGK